MASLVTLTEVKTHMKLTGTTEHDADLTLKMDEAEVLVLNYLKSYAGDDDAREARYAVIDAWTASDVPKPVRSAIFRMVGHLRGDAGDDPELTKTYASGDDLPPNVRLFLTRYKDPAFA